MFPQNNPCVDVRAMHMCCGQTGEGGAVATWRANARTTMATRNRSVTARKVACGTYETQNLKSKFTDIDAVRETVKLETTAYACLFGI